MSATALYALYKSLVDDPFKFASLDPKGAPVAFSACKYAHGRCEEIAAGDFFSASPVQALKPPTL
jgi:hypothetical protein